MTNSISILITVLFTVLFLGCSDNAKNTDINMDEPVTSPEQTIFNENEEARNLPYFLKMCENPKSYKKDSTWTPYWAQRVLGADLALNLIQDINADLSKVKIAVIDTGFDFSGNRKNINVESIEAEYSGTERYPNDPTKDAYGHGTAVIGTIAGRDGIGISPGVHIKIFSFVPDEDKINEETKGLSFIEQHRFQREINKTIAPGIKKAIKSACSQGYRIINMSLGNPDGNEADLHWKTSENLELIDWLSKKGCLVVNASGNSAYIGENKFKILERNKKDSWLEVAAKSYGNTSAAFSTLGDIEAPGENIYTLKSSEKTSFDFFIKRCQTKDSSINGQFISGTSFSSPFTAGVTGLIQATLNLSEKYQNLNPQEQIRLWKRIAIESDVYGTVNAVKAIKNSLLWIQTNDTEEKKIKNLNTLNCTNQNISCTNKTPLECADHQRARIMACGNKNDLFLNTISLVDLYTDHGHIEPAVYWLSSLKDKKTGLPGKTISLAALRVWNKYSSRAKKLSILSSDPDAGKIDFLTGSRILELITTDKEANSEKLKSALSVLLSNKSNYWEIAVKAKGRRGQEVALLLSSLFKILIGFTPIEELWEVYQNALDSVLNNGSSYNISNSYILNGKREAQLKFKGYFPTVRLLNNLWTVDLPNSSFATLKKIENKFVKRFIESNGDINIWDLNPNLSWNSRNERHLDVNELTPLFLRNFDDVKDRIQPLLNESSEQILKSGSLVLPYLIYADVNRILPKGSRVHLLKNLFDRVIDFEFPYLKNTSSFPNNISLLDSLIQYVYNDDVEEVGSLSEIRPISFKKKEDFVYYIQEEIQSTSNLSLYRNSSICRHDLKISDGNIDSIDTCKSAFTRLTEILKISDPLERLSIISNFHSESFIEELVYISRFNQQFNFDTPVKVYGVGKYGINANPPYVSIERPSSFHSVRKTTSESFIDFIKLISELHTLVGSNELDKEALEHIDTFIVAEISSLSNLLVKNGELDMFFPEIIKILENDKSWISSIQGLVSYVKSKGTSDYRLNNIEKMLELFNNRPETLE